MMWYAYTGSMYATLKHHINVPTSCKNCQTVADAKLSCKRDHLASSFNNVFDVVHVVFVS